MRSSISTWIFSLKVVLISAGVVSVAMAMKFSLPLLFNFAVADLRTIWSVLLSWLKPPYLYVVINGIIITIAASSRFHHRENRYQPLINPTNAHPPSDLPSELHPVSIQPRFVVMEHPPGHEIEPRVMEMPPVVSEIEPPVIDVEMVPVDSSENIVTVADEDEFVISRSTWIPPQRMMNTHPLPENIVPEFRFPVREKPLVSSRFANHRKLTKNSTEGVRALRVAKPRKHETLENTWKTITDGRHMPLARHLRKSETFENHNHEVVSNKKVMKKADTFKDHTGYDNKTQRRPAQKPATNSSPASGGKLRKEGSPSHDELNRRVEAFIKKVNDEMRLQRQESLNQYMEMINRGA